MTAHWLDAPGWLPLIHTLLHTLWQGALAAGGLFLALRAIPASRANLRYGFSVAALLLLLLASVATWAMLDTAARADDRPKTTARTESASVPVAIPPAPMPLRATVSEWTMPPPPAIEKSWTRRVVAVWLLGVGICLTRAVSGAIGAERLRRRCRELNDPRILALVDELRARLRLRRRVRVLVSAEIGVPAVMGVFWPAILLPAALLARVPVEDLRAVLAHELAHVWRWDYLVNFGQMLAEALLFFNPFAWWISRRMRVEREACCDEIAARECGSPARYVEALVSVIACVHPPCPAPLMAADGPPEKDRAGNALDRARRLLVPGYLPALRLRWFSALAALALSAVALYGLSLGARAAARVLTAKKRIETITRVQAEYKPPVYPGGRFEFAGTVLTEAGAPVDGVKVRVRSRRDIHSSFYSATTGKDGGFRVQADFGSISVDGTKEGFAPFSLGPIEVAGSKPDPVKIVLTAGFDASIETVDETGAPIKGVRLPNYYSGEMALTNKTLVTDAAGIAVLPHATNAPLTMQADVDGYQFDLVKDVRLEAGKPYRWTLRRARPVTGLVVSSVDGQPIAGAKIKLSSITGAISTNISSEPENAPVRAVSDAQGRFTLTNLRPDCRWFIFAEAPGHGGVVFDFKGDDQENVRVLLGPELLVRGRIVNIPPADAGSDGRITLRYGQKFTFGNGSYQRFNRLELTPKNGEAEFTLGPLYAAPLDIQAGSGKVSLALADLPKAGLKIDLAPSPNSAEPDLRTREVVFRFRPPEGLPAPTGSVRVSGITLASRRNGQESYESIDVPIQNGTAKLEVPLPNDFMSYFPEGMIGYAFPEVYQLAVKAGGGSQVIDVPVTPAGAIFGEALEEDGSPARELLISVDGVKWPGDGRSLRLPTVKDHAMQGRDGTGRFIASPLPFGGVYAVVAHRDATFAVSESLRVDEAASLHHARLVLPAGRTVTGRMLAEENGAPIASSRYVFVYRAPWGHEYSGTVRWTDSAGKFSVPGVNLNAPGKYLVRMESQSQYQPMEKALPAGETGVELRLRAGKVLEGMIIEAKTNAPVEGIEVRARYADNSFYVNNPRLPTPGFTSFEAEGKSDARGRFRFSNLPDADVILNVGNANIDNPGNRMSAHPGPGGPVEVRVNLLATGAEDVRGVRP